ncbi:NAD-dependent protein deacetylase HST1-like protein [Quillaja saponaria]|uniref:Protein TILLER ANGLE CONTROL 1 n=1 Tax=Quillaja saponaria TaxID=32244 RepID=A0AAD7LSE0_QUISA|nr:NAD-dependent protein deacetylase HST1-like protein [Quillaja saponaria]
MNTKQENSRFMIMTDEDDIYNFKHDEELNPLMFTMLEHNFDDFSSNNAVPNPIKQDLVMNFDHQVALNPFVNSLEVYESKKSEEITNQTKNKGERITLADLFLADSDVKIKLDPAKFLLDSSNRQNLKKKHGLSFAKKLIPRVKDDTHPMKNLKRLMGRMLKRKIHPELDAKMKKPDGHKTIEVGAIISTKQQKVSESVCLLPIQGASM